MAEWLRRLTRNQFPSGSAGSNPADCDKTFSLPHLWHFTQFFPLPHSWHSYLLSSLPHLWHPCFSINLLKMSKKCLETGGIDPPTSHMLSERSTIWATSPFKWEDTQKRPLCIIIFQGQHHFQLQRSLLASQFMGGIHIMDNQNYFTGFSSQKHQTFDSSVGRAVDCSCTLSDIHRSLVQIRLEGVFVLDQLLQSHLLCVSSIIVESCKMPG